MRIVHEASIASEIYDIVERNIKDYKIKCVTLILIKVGSFNGINEESLRFAFKVISKGSKCENAKIILEAVEGFELLVEKIEGEEYEEHINTEKDTTI